MQEEAIIVFIKSPEAGKVKSRLASSIGQERACTLYRCFVEDLLDTMGGLPQRLRLYYTPGDAEAPVAAWLGDRDALFPQRGEDLGRRMCAAFDETFQEGFRSAILIGSDTSDLLAAALKEGFDALSVHDAVLGPSMDGGYYLIGFRSETFRPEVFEGVSWSTAAVFQQTLDTFMTLGDMVHLLPVRRDVDTIEDLKALLHRNDGGAFMQSKTLRYLLGERILG